MFLLPPYWGTKAQRLLTTTPACEIVLGKFPHNLRSIFIWHTRAFQQPYTMTIDINNCNQATSVHVAWKKINSTLFRWLFNSKPCGRVRETIQTKLAFYFQTLRFVIWDKHNIEIGLDIIDLLFFPNSSFSSGMHYFWIIFHTKNAALLFVCLL